jgi:hypothetical protein
MGRDDLAAVVVARAASTARCAETTTARRLPRAEDDRLGPGDERLRRAPRRSSPMVGPPRSAERPSRSGAQPARSSLHASPRHGWRRRMPPRRHASVDRGLADLGEEVSQLAGQSRSCGRSRARAARRAGARRRRCGTRAVRGACAPPERNRSSGAPPSPTRSRPGTRTGHQHAQFPASAARRRRSRNARCGNTSSWNIRPIPSVAGRRERVPVSGQTPSRRWRPAIVQQGRLGAPARPSTATANPRRPRGRRRPVPRAPSTARSLIRIRAPARALRRTARGARAHRDPAGYGECGREALVSTPGRPRKAEDRNREGAAARRRNRAPPRTRARSRRQAAATASTRGERDVDLAPRRGAPERCRHSRSRG